MWIMLTKKLPTVVSPPKLSIFWSIPWPLEVKERNVRARSRESAFSKMLDKDASLWGREHDYEGARKILYKDESVRVFPEEFTEIDSKKLMFYIDEGLYELTPNTVAEDELMEEKLTKGKRMIFDAALVDGCTPAQAMLVALGKDPTIESPEVPAIGWYKCREEYARYFCYEKEMEG